MVSIISIPINWYLNYYYVKCVHNIQSYLKEASICNQNKQKEKLWRKCLKITIIWILIGFDGVFANSNLVKKADWKSGRGKQMSLSYRVKRLEYINLWMLRFCYLDLCLELRSLGRSLKDCLRLGLLWCLDIKNWCIIPHIFTISSFDFFIYMYR